MYNLLAFKSDTGLANCVEITINNKFNVFLWYILSNNTHSSVCLFPFPSLLLKLKVLHNASSLYLKVPTLHLPLLLIRETHQDEECETMVKY